MAGQYVRFPTTGVPVYASSSQLPALSYDGALAVAADTDTLYIFHLATVTWLVVGTGGSAVTSIGAFGSSPNSAGGSISSNVLTLQPASASFPGGVSTSAQSFAGLKTFADGIYYKNPNTSSIARTIAGWIGDQVFSVKDFGAVGDGVTDDKAAIQAALNAANTVGGGTVYFPPTTSSYATTNTLLVYSKTKVDLNGQTVKRIGATTTAMFTNAHFGVPGDENIIFQNGIIRGTGANGSVDGQGAAIAIFYGENVLIQNIQTVNTNGDGMQFRLTDYVIIRDSIINNYGRNGISPTSGIFVYDNLQVLGTPFTGADPGLDFDSENDSVDETGKHFIINCNFANMTFVDFFSLAAGDFAHEIYMENTKVRGGTVGLKIQATNNVTAQNVYIGPNCSINASGASAAAMSISNVNGIKIHGSHFGIGGVVSGTQTAILIGTATTVSALSVDGATFQSGFGSGIDARFATAMNTSSFRNLALTSLYIIGASNLIDNSVIGTLTISGVGSTGNNIGAACQISTYTLTGSATFAGQTYPTIQQAYIAGKLGVGTTSPGSSLDVRGGNAAVNAGNAFAATGVGVYGDANSEYIRMYHSSSVATIQSTATGSGTVRNLDLVVGASTRLRIDASTGDVLMGISTTSPTFISSASNPASAGVLRLASTDAIKWRNNANGADVALAKNTSDALTYAGTAFLSSSAVLLAAAFPALTGDVTTSAGALATTVAKIQTTTVSGTTGSGSVVFSAAPVLTGLLSAGTGYFTGSVGIGTNSPTFILSGSEVGLQVVASGSNSAGLGVQSTNSGNIRGAELYAANSVDEVGINAINNATTKFCIRTGGSGAIRFTVDALGNVFPGTAALATNATDGFIYLPTCAGTPTGVPTAYTGRVAHIYDTSNNKLYVYNGAWKSVTLA